MAVVTLTYLGIGLAALLLAISVYQNTMLVRSLGLGRDGSLLLWQKLTLKLWVCALLVYILVGTMIGGFPPEVRRPINLGLIVVLIVQAAWESYITQRWRKATPPLTDAEKAHLVTPISFLVAVAIAFLLGVGVFFFGVGDR